MRSYFNAALTMVVASAQQDLYNYGPGSPLMAVGRLGEGLDMASRHGDPYGRTVYDHGERISAGGYMPETHRADPHMVERHDREQHHRAVTGIDHSRYFEPAHTAEHGPIHQELTREDREHMHSRTHDAEAMDPHHVFHSAE